MDYKGTPLISAIVCGVLCAGAVIQLSHKNRLMSALIAFVINYACYFPKYTVAELKALTRAIRDRSGLGLTRTDIL